MKLSPFYLPLKPGVQKNSEPAFQGLFGLFNDSLPDGWTELLINRQLQKRGLNPFELGPLDKLSLVGKNAMGALSYLPSRSERETVYDLDLDVIAKEVTEFEENESLSHIDELVNLAGASTGARPKALITINKENYIVKFRSIVDLKDQGNIEYAYHLLAKSAGLSVPTAKLFPSKIGRGYFGVKRFDRQPNKVFHMHTISGLLQVDHRLPSLDFQAIMQATQYLTKDIVQLEKQFLHCVFNVLTHNRDDHAKNFAFLMQPNGIWQVSPAYDLTFSFGPSGEHCTMVMGAFSSLTKPCANVYILAHYDQVSKHKQGS